MQLDTQRCLQAFRQIAVTGRPVTQMHRDMIEAAIAEIQTDGAAALQKRMCMTRYAHFGAELMRLDPGEVPPRGRVVFEIARQPTAPPVLNEDKCCYLLLALLDWQDYVDIPDPPQPGPGDPPPPPYTPQAEKRAMGKNICDLIRKVQHARDITQTIQAEVDSLTDWPNVDAYY